jgi:hypothetical protein
LLASSPSSDGNGADVLALPIVGPIIWGHSGECDEDGTNCPSPTLGWMLGLGQAVGVTLFVVGVRTRDRYYKRADLVTGSITLSPLLVGGRSPGLGVTARL